MGAAIQLPSVSVGGENFDRNVLNMLLPMHVQLDAQGMVSHIGPTFAKLIRDMPPIEGNYILNYIEFSYPKDIQSEKDLAGHYGMPLIAHIKGQAAFDLKAVVVQMPGNTGVLLDFSFGTSLQNAVKYWHLNSKDFSPADPTVEMLYIIEVQSSLLEESQNLNNRLNGQREEAEEKAYTDPLTGLSNRRGLDRYIKRLARRREKGGFAVLLIDLDHFKSVNDTLGHAAGDRVLQEVAEILLHETRPTDIVVRTGGDEFVLVISNVKDANSIETIAKRIIRKIERPITWEDQRCHIGASIGIVTSHTTTNSSVEYYLQAADEALYASKNNGRGQFCFAI